MKTRKQVYNLASRTRQEMRRDEEIVLTLAPGLPRGCYSMVTNFKTIDRRSKRGAGIRNFVFFSILGSLPSRVHEGLLSYDWTRRNPLERVNSEWKEHTPPSLLCAEGTGNCPTAIFTPISQRLVLLCYKQPSVLGAVTARPAVRRSFCRAGQPAAPGARGLVVVVSPPRPTGPSRTLALLGRGHAPGN